MIGSPSGETGIGPLISCLRPSSPNSGMRSAVASAISSKRSMFGGSSSCANSNGTPFGMERRRAHLPAADGEAADLGLQIEVQVRVAQRRQLRVAISFIGSVTTYWCSSAAAGNAHAHELADRARPDAGRDHHGFAVDGAFVRQDTRDSSASNFEAGDTACPAGCEHRRARALRERLRQARRIDVAVARHPGRAGDAVEGDVRESAPAPASARSAPSRSRSRARWSRRA